MVLDNFQVEQSRVLYVVVNYVPIVFHCFCPRCVHQCQSCLHHFPSVFQYRDLFIFHCLDILLFPSFWILRVFKEEPNELSVSFIDIAMHSSVHLLQQKRHCCCHVVWSSKTAALGVSLVSSQYGSHNPKLGIILVPLVLIKQNRL